MSKLLTILLFYNKDYMCYRILISVPLKYLIALNKSVIIITIIIKDTNWIPMDLIVVVKVIKTFQNLPQNCCNCHFVKYTSCAVRCSHAMFDNVQ